LLAHIVAARLTLVPIELTFDKVLVFPKAKDHPVILSAL
jgi:hypothetical protein